MTVFSLGLCALVAVLYHLMPRLTRPELYFAVTVSATFRAQPEARAALGRYRAWVWFHAVTAAALIALGAQLHREVLFSVSLAWQLVGSLQAFLAARRAVLPYAAAPSTIREATLVPERRALPGGPLAQLGPFLLLAVAAVALTLHPGRAVAHSPLGVLGVLLTGAMPCALLLLLAYGILSWSRRVRATGEPAERERQFRGATLVVLLGAEYLVALRVALVALSPLATSAQGRAPLIVMLVELALVIGAVTWLMRLSHGRAGSAAPHEGTPQPIGDRTADASWRWGIFYFDPSDPAVFVEKRFGIGYTLNFGSRQSWLILALVVIVPLVSSLLARR